MSEIAGLCEREKSLSVCGCPSTVTFPRCFQINCPGSPGSSMKRPYRQTVFSPLTWSRRQRFAQNQVNLPCTLRAVEASQPGTGGRIFSNSPSIKRSLSSSKDSSQCSSGTMAQLASARYSSGQFVPTQSFLFARQASLSRDACDACFSTCLAFIQARRFLACWLSSRCRRAAG